MSAKLIKGPGDAGSSKQSSSEPSAGDICYNDLKIFIFKQDKK